MSFERALRERVPPRALGDVVLRYDGPMLVGEVRQSRAALTSLPEALTLAALCSGLLAAAVLIAGGPLLLALGFVLSCIVLLFAGTRLRANWQARRRFVLNFSDETLRIERAPSLRRAALVRVFSFDDVREVHLFASTELEIRVELASGEQFPLVSHAPLEAEDDARNLQRIFRDAFGVSRKPPTA